MVHPLPKRGAEKGSYMAQDDVDTIRLWNHVLVQVYGTSDLSLLKTLPPDPEAHAFFEAIEQAFSATPDSRCDDGCVPVHQHLASYMASWGRQITNGYDEKGGAIGEGYNHHIRRAFSGFVETLRNAIKLNNLRHFSDGRVMFGCFVLPTWIIEKYLDEVQEEAEHVNQMRSEYGAFD